MQDNAIAILTEDGTTLVNEFENEEPTQPIAVLSDEEQAWIEVMRAQKRRTRNLRRPNDKISLKRATPHAQTIKIPTEY